MRESKERHLLYLGLFVAMVPVLLLRDFTPSNELRYLSVADEALRNGTFFAFTNHGVPFTDKPPLYIWIVMLCRWITGGHHMWLLGLFSLVPAVLIARVIDRWTEHDIDSYGRSTARLMLITSGIFFVTAVTIRPDMLMALFIVLALREFWRLQSGEPGTERCKWTFPLYVFLAILSKGMLGLIIPFGVTVVYLFVSGNIRKLFRYWGWRTWGVLIVCCAVWAAAIYAEAGWPYLHEFLVNQAIERTFDSVHHAQPFYYYMLTIWYSLAPWSLLVIGIIIAALQPGFVRSGIQTFFLTAAITIFFLLSCVESKMQIYMLPAIPFMVYGAAMFLPRFRDYKLIRLSLAIPAAIILLSLPVLAVAVAFSDEIDYLDNGLIYAAATVLTLTGGNALYHLYFKNIESTLQIVRRIAGGIGMAVFVAAWALPKVGADTGYGRLCKEALAVSSETGINEVKAWHISHAENMDAYLDRPVNVIDKNKVPTADAHKPYLLLTRKSDLKTVHGRQLYVIGPYAVVVMK